ncbi:MAG: hypothetical protein ACW99U_18275 [Candidatus Thorarchaeota archaeon]|jgi:hypothetical protein
MLEENKGGRRWACGLFLQHGSWEKVHEDERHINIVIKLAEEAGLGKNFKCRDYPQKYEKAWNKMCCFTENIQVK